MPTDKDHLRRCRRRPTILSILCPTGKRSSHCSEAAAATAVAAVSISFGSRVTTQLEKGSRRKEGRKRDMKEKGIPNSVRSGVPWVPTLNREYRRGGKAFRVSRNIRPRIVINT